MAFKLKYNMDKVIKLLQKDLDIEGYERFTMDNLRCYINSSDDYVTAIIASNKMKLSSGIMPIFRMKFTREIFGYKDTKHIITTFEEIRRSERLSTINTALDAMYTVGKSALKFGAMPGHSFELLDTDKKIFKVDKMYCIPGTIDDKLEADGVSVIVCDIYPLTNNEYKSLNKFGGEDRFNMLYAKELTDAFEGRIFGEEVKTECNFDSALESYNETMKYAEKSMMLAENAVEKARELGGFNFEGNTLKLETKEEFERFIDILQSMENQNIK